MKAAAIEITATPVRSVGLAMWEMKMENHARNVLITISPITRIRNEYVGRLTFFINNHYPTIITSPK
jgi:hypothetical protein